MKCVKCGSNLTIDDKFCSYCGSANVYAVQHRKDMQHFREDYYQTKRNVIERSGRKVSRIAKGTIIAGLVVLCFFILLASANAYRISDWVKRAELKKDTNIHKNNLDKLEADRDFFGLASYYQINELYLSDDLREYETIANLSYYYLFIYDYTHQVLNSEKYPYMSTEDLTEYIGDYIKMCYDGFEFDEYRQEQYSETHMAAIQDLRDELETFIHVYLKVPKEDIEKFQQLSAGKIQLVIERSLDDAENEY
ncbi:MAG: zinc ribbon domain-containing protein [Epulopiscium sp.]|nr:zinc ribbon domain-containing protein [Candidatus Epulonipiscium sp.]